MPLRRFKGSFLWFYASFRTFSLSATTAIEDVPVLFKMTGEVLAVLAVLAVLEVLWVR